MTPKRKLKTFRFEGEFNLFYKLVMLVKSNPMPVTLTILLVFLCGTMWLQFQYFQIQLNKTKQDAQVIREAVAPNESGVVERKLETDKKVEVILEQFRATFDADRAKLFQYHNSVTSVAGVKFLYISATNEVTRPGVSKEYSNLQRLPSSLFNATVQRFVDKSATVCVKRSSISGDPGVQYFDNQGIMTSCNYPVTVSNNIIGIITLNFNTARTDLDEKKIKDQLSFTAIRVADVLAP
jgi:hypothetical protein